MQRNCRFEIISVSRDGNSLSCSTEWDKSVFFTPSNLLPKSVVKMKHLTREQRYGISLMLQEGKSRKDIAKAIGVSTSTIGRELRKNCNMRNGTYNYDLAQRKYETRLKLRGLDTYNYGRQWKEFAKHQEIAKELEISFYFCKTYHSWERGANENMNGLIRQYIPKGTDFSGITDEFVAWVEEKLNNRPRKRLGYLTPNEKFNLLLTN